MKRAWGLCVALLLSGSAFATGTVRHLALVDGGKQAGHQIVSLGDDGVARVDFLFEDNGRGPELKEGAKYSRTLADRGSITAGKRADLVLFDGEPTVDIAARAGLALTGGTP